MSLKTGVPAPGGDPSAGRGPRREAVPQDDTGDVVVVRELERRVRTTKETPFTAHRLRPPRAGDELVSTTHQCPRHRDGAVVVEPCGLGLATLG